jgi:DNA repair exonuclease SbcCD nuclease subunit
MKICLFFRLFGKKDKMKILLIGDPHFRKDNLDLMSRICQEILQLIDERNPDLVISLGDTLDTHERIYMPALTDATNFYLNISKKCPLILLIGNHDRENNSDFLSQCHPFVGLKEHPNITVVDTTIWDRERNFIYVPYVANGRFNEALSKVGYVPFQNGIVNLEGEHPLFLFAHQEFQGCLMGAKTSSDGDVWSTHLPQIFSGHIHEYQVLPRIVYVGTFMQQNYGESTDKALIMIYTDEETETVPDSKVIRPKFRTERIRLNSAPSKITIHLTLAELPNFASKIPPNCMVKVVIHLDATETEGLKQNPHYRALKGIVDKVVEKIESNKASLAQATIMELKNTGRLVPSQPEQRVFKLEEVVRAMLADDPFTLSLFQNEIAV